MHIWVGKREREREREVTLKASFSISIQFTDYLIIDNRVSILQTQKQKQSKIQYPIQTQIQIKNLYGCVLVL
jgi:hypothetical protein